MTHQNFGCHFLGQSLLLSATILNDYAQMEGHLTQKYDAWLYLNTANGVMFYSILKVASGKAY